MAEVSTEAQIILHAFCSVYGSEWRGHVRRVRYYQPKSRRKFASLEIRIGTEETLLRLQNLEKKVVDKALREGGAQVAEEVAKELFRISGKEWDRYDHPSENYSEWFEKGK